jgi:hypothetical protein
MNTYAKALVLVAATAVLVLSGPKRSAAPGVPIEPAPIDRKYYIGAI